VHALPSSHAVPLAFAAQVPTDPGTLQDMQVPEQAVAQQTPSMQ
jgi:hypothetical protein